MNKQFAFWLLIVCALLVVVPAGAQDRPQSRITQAINGSRRITLAGNMHPMARAEFDRGTAPGDLPMQQMQLVLTRSAAQQADLERLLAAQQDPTSPDYHRWLTPEQFGQRFGASDDDVQEITSWLELNGFHVDRVANGRNLIEFTGSANQVDNAFHTQIHRYIVNGQSHWANASDPEIPAALAGVVAGVATLHNFQKKPQAIRSVIRPQFTASNGGHALGPADYATIYNINPLYVSGINGSDTTIAVVGRSNINLQDVISFRNTFNLTPNTPQIIVNGRDPGVLGNGEVDEATLDVTWAGAVAPNATVKLVVTASTNTSDGVDLSEEYIIDNNLADIMTESFGSCEASYTQAQAALISSLAEQAAAQGITYVVASGDSGAEGCDNPAKGPATRGPSVNILSSTPYNIAVGGTQFNEGASTYWNSGSGVQGFALSYIPELVWNESSGGVNPPVLWASGGGVSILVSKPFWQAGVSGIPSDDHRYVPDVSLTAGGHDPYALCLSCTASNDLRYYGGTSAATASFAGIMALVVQKTGSRQGQANVVLYRLAAQQQYSQCNSSSPPASHCIFNDITDGNNGVPGGPAGLYPATAGYDLATGLGSVNVTNLVNAWNATPAQFRYSIDAPSPAPVAGLTRMNGWAVTDSVGISNVEIAVDGVSYGNTTYGIWRGDVCAVYPNRPSCPNVGWTFDFDTTRLPDGIHRLDVIMTAATGQKYTASSNFTIANVAAGNPMRIQIDSAGSSTLLSSPAVLFGWAIDNLDAISRVSLSVDGVFVQNATYGIARTDVCAAFPGRIGCPNVGWTSLLDVASLPNGTHTLAVTATTTSGRSSVVTSSFATNFADTGRLSIDLPTPQSGPLSGPVNLFGWALSGLGTINRVEVAIDAVRIGQAHYGDSRPDVCTVYPNSIGCPSVGWHYLLDTTQFADGAHTLQVTEFDASGPTTATASFTIANGGNAANPTKVTIDAPTPQATLFGTTTIEGWAVNDHGAINSVAISVDGIPKGTATYGVSRGDVCVVYANRTGCPNVGWVFSLDTTQLANGPHVIQATASSGAQYGTTSRMFTASNWTTNPTRITIDQPAAQGAASGVVNAFGWAIDDVEAITSVAISIDGVLYGNASYGGSRADVCAAFPGRAGCPNVGWNFLLDTRLLSDGTHVFGVTSTSASGRHSTVTSPFSVSNASGNPIRITIDSPALNGTVSGTVQAFGWALEGGNQIASVQVLVDGVSYGAANYGDFRPDVCALYSSPNCANVGWHFSLDTTGLANGMHTFTVQAADAAGFRRTVSNTFQVSNGLYLTIN